MRDQAMFKAAAALLVAVIVVLGVWVGGGAITDDEAGAKWLTASWIVLCGLGVLAVGWRWRPLAGSVIGTYLVVVATVGGFLVYTSSVDKVVDEDVVVADNADPSQTSPSDGARDGARDGDGDGAGASAEQPNRNVEVASGSFVDGAHPTEGTARIIKTAAGELVLTLTDFATDPGPDLRVYLAPRGAEGVADATDIGALKGNKGAQQYDVPAGVSAGRVVIWCRAFSVSFGSAQLRPAIPGEPSDN